MLATMNERGTENGDGTVEAEGSESSEQAEAAGTSAPTQAAAQAVDPLAEAKADTARMREQLLRTAADFDNYRKRSRREVEDAYKKGSEELLRTLLPVFDNMERAVMHAEQTDDSKAIADGVKMVLKQFVDTLARLGITRVPTVGNSFDPLIHEAIQQVETVEHAPGTVVAEVAPGYKMGDRLIRAAMVVVAKPPSTDGGEPADN